jgi:hypothetical protein
MAVNPTIFSYLGRTPEEVEGLVGAYGDTVWFTGYMHRFGDYWFTFDGNVEYPEGLSCIVIAPLYDVVEGLSGPVSLRELDELLGERVAFVPSDENEGEWHIDAFVIYDYDGYEIQISCSDDMYAEPDATTWVIGW